MTTVGEVDYLFGVAAVAWCWPLVGLASYRQWTGRRFRFQSVAPPPYWPGWGWDWRAMQRSGVVGMLGVFVPLPIAGLIRIEFGHRAVNLFAALTFGTTALLFLCIALWSRPKRLIPPWARAQSGAIREWSDWWKLRDR
jgi:hypothetical protein